MSGKKMEEEHGARGPLTRSVPMEGGRAARTQPPLITRDVPPRIGRGDEGDDQNHQNASSMIPNNGTRSVGNDGEETTTFFCSC